MQATIETEIIEGEFSPLPPMHEISLSSSDMQVVQTYFNRLRNGHSFRVMMLCRQTKALKVGEFVLGAKGSSHSRSSFVLAHRSDETVCLAEVLECIAIADNEPIKLWVRPPSPSLDMCLFSQFTFNSGERH